MSARAAPKFPEMTKHRWKESMKSFGTHLDPEKDDQLKWIKIEIDNKLGRILKLVKSINQGNKDGNSKKKLELAQLIGDFHKEYQSLYALYDDLKGEVRKNVHAKEDDSSASSSPESSDSESYYSPDEVGNEKGESSDDIQQVAYGYNQKLETSDSEDAVLKDKLTSTSVVKETLNLEHMQSLSNVASLKVQLENLCTLNTELEEQIDSKATETKLLLDENLGLKARILELEMKSQEDEISASPKKFQKNEKQATSNIQSFMVEARNLQSEIDSSHAQKGKLEDQTICTNYDADVPIMEKELEVRILELERTLRGKIDEICALQQKIDVQENDLSTQITSLTSQVDYLHQEGDLLLTEKSQLQFQLEKEKNRYSQSLIHVDKQKDNLTNKISDQHASMKEMQDVIERLNEELKQANGRFLESLPNLQILEKKIEEKAEDFRKKFEGNLRILSQRIRIAEQLHVETKEWCKELKERMETNEMEAWKTEEISLTANDMLTELDTLAWKLEECNANFPTRISKVSCELMYAKDWVMRKNQEMKHVKEDLESVLVQMDDKEAEILTYREKVWKLENKVRETEKMVKEKEEGLVGLKEEKREAIRQLCVWIDYHRSHCDYYKKMLRERNFRSQRTIYNKVVID